MRWYKLEWLESVIGGVSPNHAERDSRTSALADARVIASQQRRVVSVIECRAFPPYGTRPVISTVIATVEPK